MAVIELEVLSGKGGWEGSKGNLTGYNYKESSTPLAADDTSGATPSFTTGVSEDDDIDGTFALLESKVKLSDDATGSSIGVVRTITSVDGAVGLEIESILSLLNAEVSVGPFSGTLAAAFDFYMTVAGVGVNDYSVDASLAGRAVAFPGWYGSMWENLKKLCVAQQIEIATVSGRIIVRPIRTVLGTLDRDISATFTVDNTTVAKAVEVYYYNNVYKPVGLFYPVNGIVSDLPDTAVQTSAQNFQVEAGETVVASVPISAYIQSINQPIPATFVDEYLVTTASIYTVIDKDGLIVEPGLWTGTGGSITAAAGQEPNELVITVTGAALSSRAPFRIAMPKNPDDPENQDTFPSLRISGEGVFYTKKMFTMPTGADPAYAVADVGVTIDNPFISTIEEASSAGVLAARNYSGRNKQISVQATSVADIGINGAIAFYPYQQFEDDNPGVTYAQYFQTGWAGKSYADFQAFARSKSANGQLVQAFGNVVGARVPFRDAIYRIREVTYTEDGLQYTAEADTIATDFASKFSGVTYNEFAYMKPGRTYNDFALAPLWRTDDYIVPVTGYGISPYGINSYGD